MSVIPVQPTNRSITPAKGFISVFLAVFTVVFASSALITFLLPETFVGVARVRATTPQQVAVFQSENVLTTVAEQQDLKRSFGERYGENQPLTTERTIEMLRRVLRVRPVEGTGLAEIRVYSISPKEAASLANAIAQTGVSSTASPTQGMAVVDLAVPPLKPVRPNKPLNLALGALVGTLLGAMAGGVGARLAIGVGRDNRIQMVSP